MMRPYLKTMLQLHANCQKLVAYYQYLADDHVDEGLLALRGTELLDWADPDPKAADQLLRDINDSIADGGGSALLELSFFVKKWCQSFPR